jgi:hypothetical protein
VSSCEHGNEDFGSIKGMEFRDCFCGKTVLHGIQLNFVVYMILTDHRAYIFTIKQFKKKGVVNTWIA